MPSSILILGTNQGDRKALLDEALAMINLSAGKIIKQSAVYKTAAWGREELPAHLNMAVQIETELEPLDLLDIVQKIELELGRERQEKWGLRTMDIDIIFYDDIHMVSKKLTIPHPLMQERNFVLFPICEIAPEYLHPVFKKSVASLLNETIDNLSVKLY